jgi:hypothetical protein
MTAVGKRTSVYLSDGLAAAVSASGVPLAELIRRGLGAGSTAEPPPGEPAAPAAPRVPADRTRRRCRHPGTRVIGGWCRKCGVVVEPGGYLPG